MIEMSEEITNFILNNIDELDIPDVFKSFKIIDGFSLEDYERRYLDVIYNPNIDPNILPLAFLDVLENNLIEIIRAHQIGLTETSDPGIRDLNTICEFLRKIQGLEDYTFILRTLSGDDSDRKKFVDILVEYTDFTFIEAIDLIVSVGPNLLPLLDKLAHETIMMDEDDLIEDVPEKTLTLEFLDYVKEAKPLGWRLFEHGYDSMISIDDLIAVYPKDLFSIIKENHKSGHHVMALDILSLFMICKDSREDPLEAFNRLNEDFLDGTTDVSVVSGIISSMYSDFMNFYNVKMGVVNGNNNKA